MEMIGSNCADRLPGAPYKAQQQNIVVSLKHSLQNTVLVTRRIATTVNIFSRTTMMNQRVLSLISRRVGTAAQKRFMAADASAPATAASMVKLNFSLPHQKLYDGTLVHSVIIPGSAGEYGVTANHVPYVAQLKPGVLQIYHEENTSEPEKYFVAGGYALTHEDSSTDVVVPEAVKLDEIDSAIVAKQYEAAKSAFASSAAGSIEQAEAQIDMEVNKAMGVAIGLTLS